MLFAVFFLALQRSFTVKSDCGVCVCVCVCVCVLAAGGDFKSARVFDLIRKKAEAQGTELVAKVCFRARV